MVGLLLLRVVSHLSSEFLLFLLDYLSLVKSLLRLSQYILLLFIVIREDIGPRPTVNSFAFIQIGVSLNSILILFNTLISSVISNSLALLNIISKINRWLTLNKSRGIFLLIKPLKNAWVFLLLLSFFIFIRNPNVLNKSRIAQILKSKSNISLLGQILKEIILSIKDLLIRREFILGSFFKILQKVNYVIS